MITLAFPRELRLLTPAHFSYVFQQPFRIGRSEITILGRANSLGYPRIGLTIAKKNIKKAHDRNRVKRLARESFRLHQHVLPAMDFVLIGKKGLAELDNQAIMKTLDKIWHRYSLQSP